ncbi:MAG: NUDIX hydrolase [Patescibacteria group bacterium]
MFRYQPRLLANPVELFKFHPEPDDHYWPQEKNIVYKTDEEKGGLTWLAIRPEGTDECWEGSNKDKWAMPISQHAAIGIVQLVENGQDTGKYVVVTKATGYALAGGTRNYISELGRFETDEENFRREVLEETGAEVKQLRHWITFKSPMEDRLIHDCSVWISKAEIVTEIELDDYEQAIGLSIHIFDDADQFIDSLLYNFDYFLNVAYIYMAKQEPQEPDNKWRSLFKKMIALQD